MATSYSTGAVNIGAGSTTLTGTGTAWLTAGAIRAGDNFNAAGMSVRIASVNSNTSITLARPWPGGALSGANYDIWLKFDDDRALATSIKLMAALDGGALEALSGLAGGANQLAFFTGVGTMGQTGLTAEARTLLASTLLSRSGNNLVTPAAARLTGGAVTQSPTDATAGRLLKFGDFGIGHAITLTAAMNLNDIAVSGHYFNATGGNTPGNNYPVSSAGVLLHVSSNTNNLASQIYALYGSGAVYTRSKGAGGAWSAWIRLDVERGSNANGDYARFGDGTMICTRTADLGSILANGSGTLAQPYYTNPATLSFAAGFSAAPALTFAFPTAQGIGVPDRVLVPAGYDVGVGSVTSFRVARIGGTATVANVICTITAIGRWF